MSDFDDWYDNNRPPMYSVHTDRQSQDRCIAEQSFYAGMERAAEIADKRLWAYEVVIAIRKEIT